MGSITSSIEQDEKIKKDEVMEEQSNKTEDTEKDELMEEQSKKKKETKEASSRKRSYKEMNQESDNVPMSKRRKLNDQPNKNNNNKIQNTEKLNSQNYKDSDLKLEMSVDDDKEDEKININPVCICGEQLTLVSVRDCYETFDTIWCDICGKTLCTISHLKR